MTNRETATYTCPECRYQIRTLADEYGDHACPRCGWEPYSERDLRADVRKYVVDGGRDAISFSFEYSPKYDRVPGREIQRMIDKELPFLTN